MNTRAILLLAAAALAPTATYAADAYPTRPVRIIVPFAPGGGTDVTARIVGTPLAEKLGQAVIIENRPGAGTMLGTELTAKSAPDGYTLMIASASHAINPTLYRKVNYDPIRDFTAVTMAISFPFALVVTPSMPVKSVKELIAYAKANPGKLSYASSGTGSTNHLAGELFKSTAGIDIVHIPYKGGGPAAVPRPVLARLNKEMTGILASATVKERLLATGAEPWPTSPEDAQKFIASEVARWGKLIRAARITAD